MLVLLICCNASRLLQSAHIIALIIKDLWQIPHDFNGLAVYKPLGSPKKPESLI